MNMNEEANLLDTCIGNYRIVAELGQGGMGRVYKALHEQLRRPAAIKILKREYSRQGEIVQRFLNEALAANIVQHPNLVSIFDVGTLPDGRFYIVMEYLDGETLTAYLRRGRLMPELHGLLIARQIASALALLHGQDIVHRDLKADNVMLISDTELPGGKRAKVLDFGLAKIAARHQMKKVETRDGLAMGTPPYMAPEQWISARTVDGKADVYSLGVLFYVLLAGRYPFFADSITEYQSQHMFSDPPPLSSLSPSISASVSGLALRMLAKKVSARPSMSELVALLDQELGQRGARSPIPRLSVFGMSTPTTTPPPHQPGSQDPTVPVTEKDILSEFDIEQGNKNVT